MKTLPNTIRLCFRIEDDSKLTLYDSLNLPLTPEEIRSFMLKPEQITLTRDSPTQQSAIYKKDREAVDPYGEKGHLLNLVYRKIN